MYFQLGRPATLSDIDKKPEIERLKREVTIAIIDDEPFRYKNELLTHGYHVNEIGADISSVKQIEAYSIVACDIRGVAPKFGSNQEGAHLISEIRKTYPDKYLIAYTGSNYDPSFNEKLSAADSAINKDAPFDYWHRELERALNDIGNPKSRWLRFRRSLLNDGVDSWQIFNIEQAFIKSVKTGKVDAVTHRNLTKGMSEQQIQLIGTLAKVVIPTLLKIFMNQGNA